MRATRFLPAILIVMASMVLFAVFASLAMAQKDTTITVASSVPLQEETYIVTGRVTGPDGPMAGLWVYFDCCAT